MNPLIGLGLQADQVFLRLGEPPSPIPGSVADLLLDCGVGNMGKPLALRLILVVYAGLLASSDPASAR